MRPSCSKAPPRRRARGGFTLLEVLVALTIIAVALGAALRGAMALTNNAQDVGMRQLALATAENQLLELRFARTTTGVGDAEYDCPQGTVAFHCRQSITATPNPFFRRVEIHVFTTEPAREFADLMGLLPVN